MGKPFRLAAMGGTFDHFHAGHAAFIRFAAEQADQLVIAVATDEFVVEKSWTESLESHYMRVKSVEDFCQSEQIPVEIVPLTDIYGPTRERDDFEVIVVTTETVKGAEEINRARKERGLPELSIKICDLVLAEDGQPIHSVRIRAGEINRQGKVYHRVLSADLELSDDQRRPFHQPWGEVVHQNGEAQGWQPVAEAINIVVGDVCLATFIKNGWPYRLGIYDLRSEREQVTIREIVELIPDQTLVNPAGSISQASASYITELIQTEASKQAKLHLLVQGEEDLLAVAAAVLAPLGTRVYYGQPGVGIVEMRVDEVMKEKIAQILKF